MIDRQLNVYCDQVDLRDRLQLQIDRYLMAVCPIPFAPIASGGAVVEPTALHGEGHRPVELHGSSTIMVTSQDAHALAGEAVLSTRTVAKVEGELAVAD